MRYLAILLACSPVLHGQVTPPVVVPSGAPIVKSTDKLNSSQREFLDAIADWSLRRDPSSVAATKTALAALMDDGKTVAPGVPKKGPKQPPKAGPKQNSAPITAQELSLRLNRTDPATQRAIQAFMNSLQSKPGDNDAAVKSMELAAPGGLKEILGSTQKQGSR